MKATINYDAVTVYFKNHTSQMKKSCDKAITINVNLKAPFLINLTDANQRVLGTLPASLLTLDISKHPSSDHYHITAYLDGVELVTSMLCEGNKLDIGDI